MSHFFPLKEQHRTIWQGGLPPGGKKDQAGKIYVLFSALTPATTTMPQYSKIQNLRKFHFGVIKTFQKILILAFEVYQYQNDAKLYTTYFTIYAFSEHCVFLLISPQHILLFTYILHPFFKRAYFADLLVTDNSSFFLLTFDLLPRVSMQNRIRKKIGLMFF